MVCKKAPREFAMHHVLNDIIWRDWCFWNPRPGRQRAYVANFKRTAGFGMSQLLAQLAAFYIGQLQMPGH